MDKKDKIVVGISLGDVNGIGIEIIQPFVNRYGDINDVIANSIGILILLRLRLLVVV